MLKMLICDFCDEFALIFNNLGKLGRRGKPPWAVRLMLPPLRQKELFVNDHRQVPQELIEVCAAGVGNDASAFVACDAA